MQAISKLIQDETLINLQFDSRKISTILSEILTLFKEQSKKIKKLEDDISECAKKAEFERLETTFENNCSENTKQFGAINQKISKLEEDLDNKEKKLSDKIDDENMLNLAETRRLLTAEIKAHSPEEQIKLLEDRIRTVSSDLQKVANEVDTIATPSISSPEKQQSQEKSEPKPSAAKGKMGLELQSLKSNELEKRIDDIEFKIQNYQQLDQNVNDIMVQFPLMVRNVDKKVNDLMRKAGDGSGISPVRTSESFNAKQDSGMLAEFQPPPPFPDENQDEAPKKKRKKKKENQEPTGITSFTGSGPQSVAPYAGFTKEEILKDLLEATQAQQKEREEQEKQKKEDDKESNEETEYESEDENDVKPPPIVSDKNGKGSGRFHKFISENQSLPDLRTHSARHECKDDKVIKVVENKTYKTEMNSSVRVVSELEWAKGLIQQHHEAIRQLQQNLRAQQESFETVTEGLQRVNATHNSRIAQIAQQLNKNRQEIDENEKKIVDQINRITTTIHSSRQSSQPTTAQAIAPQDYSSYQPKKPRRHSNLKHLQDDDAALQSSTIETGASSLNSSPDKTSNFDDFGLNQDEDNNYDIVTRNNEDSLKMRTSQGTETKIISAGNRLFQLNPDEEDDLGMKSPTMPRPRVYAAAQQVMRPMVRKYTFHMTHLMVQEPLYLTSDIRTINDSSIGSITSFDLFNRYNYGFDRAMFPLPRQTIQNTTENEKIEIRKVSSSDNTSMASHESKDFQQSEPGRSKPQQPILVSPQLYQIGAGSRRRYHGLTMDDIPSDLIEEKVYSLARRVVAILADSAKKDIEKEGEALKKTVDVVLTQIDGKVDRDFVERMFNKLRVAINEMNEKIDNLQCSFLEWVTRDELELVLQNFAQVVADVKDTAAAKSKYTCLLCGKPRNHLSGMIINGPTPKPSIRSSADSAILKPTVKHKSVLDDTNKTHQSSGGSTVAQIQLQVPPRNVIQYLTE